VHQSTVGRSGESFIGAMEDFTMKIECKHYVPLRFVGEGYCQVRGEYGGATSRKGKKLAAKSCDEEST